MIWSHVINGEVYPFSAIPTIFDSINIYKFIIKGLQGLEKQGMDVIVDEIGDDELTQLSRSINSISLRLKEKIEREKKNEQSKFYL